MSKVEDHIKELQYIQQRRLWELEKQAALQGSACPPHITLEIEDLQRQLRHNRSDQDRERQLIPGFANETFLDSLIKGQRQEIFFYTSLAIGISIIGITLIVVSFISYGLVMNIWWVGGGFIASISTIPVREMLSRRERIDILIAIRNRLIALDKTQDLLDAITVRRIDDLLWQVVQKTIMR